MDQFDQALKFIQAGRLDEARIYLEELLRQNSEDVDLIYNLGMLYTDLDTPMKARARTGMEYAVLNPILDELVRVGRIRLTASMQGDIVSLISG